MLVNMTPAVARALQAACAFASAQAAGQTAPRHLLAGLVLEEEGRAVELLTKAGLARTVLGEFGLSPAQATGDAGLAMPGSAVESILVRASAIGFELQGERAAASDSVLLAILEHDSGLRDLLTQGGLDIVRLDELVGRRQDAPLALDDPLELSEPTDEIETARIVDASANRAREGLRVIEDYCRFVQDDRALTEETKQIRHALTAALAHLPARTLVQARETIRDVGTAISTATEGERSSVTHVVRANLKRVQEALRSLEEYSKLLLPASSPVFESLRYRCYTLERMIFIGAEARVRLLAAKLYVLLTRGKAAASLEWTIQEAAAGGAGIFQLREKDYQDRELMALAHDVRRWTRRAGTVFIVNDRPDIARLVAADGVHLGQDDLPVKDARRILGPDALIGVSAHKPEDIEQALRDGADYLGVGPTFPSGTKSFSTLAGLEFVRTAAATTSLPWFAIGGIDASNVEQVAAAGAKRIAVSQAILASDDPRTAAARLVAAL